MCCKTVECTTANAATVFLYVVSLRKRADFKNTCTGMFLAATDVFIVRGES